MSEAGTTDVEVDVEIEMEDKGFEQAPNSLFLPEGDEPRVSDGAVRCYLVLRHFGAERSFRISVGKICRAMGKAERTVQGYMAELEAAGWLLRTPMYAQSDRRTQRASRITVLWKRASPERIAEHQKTVAANLAKHKAETQARQEAGTKPFQRRRPTKKAAPDTPQDSAGHTPQKSAPHAPQESAGYAPQDPAGYDPAFAQVSGGVSEGYPHSPTHTPVSQTSTTHTRAERGVQSSSPSVTPATRTNDQVSAVEGARSARPDGPGRAAFERAAAERGIPLKARPHATTI